MSNVPARKARAEPHADRPYSLIEDLRRALRVPPPATLALVVITVSVFIGQVLDGSVAWQRAAGIIPANLADASSLLRVGDTQALPAWLTLLSYMFLHGGLLHLLTNMSCLWLFGILAEPVMGTKRFALTYLAFGVITGMAIVAVIPHWTGPMVGASGAISGVLGAFLAQRFANSIGRGYSTGAVLVVGAIPLLAVVTWFVVRTVPSEPDRASSVAWHMIPLLFAWSSVCLWRGMGSLCRSHGHSKARA